MSDILNCPHAERAADPTAIACYTFGEGELATFSRYLNRGYGGAALDLTTRVGTPLVGQGGGVYVRDDAGSYWTRAYLDVGLSDFSYEWQHQIDSAPSAARYFINRSHLVGYFTAAGLVQTSFNGGATLSTTTYPMVGRGPYHGAALFDGVNQTLLVNGRQADSDAVVPTWAGANPLILGTYGTLRDFRCFLVRRTVAQARASYVRDFARRVVYAWAPRIVGEGPAGGIPTNAVGEGDWYAPLGGATLAFAWRHGINRLALTDSGALSMRRLAFMHTKMPAFGTWRFAFQLRDPATDNPRFGITGQRDQDFTAAGSDGYWWQVQRAAGVMQATMHEANGAALLTVNSTLAGAAGDDCEIVATRAVSGDFRLWLRVRDVWAGSEAVVANGVTSLSTSYVQIAPRQSYCYGIVRHQGEMTPAELP